MANNIQTSGGSGSSSSYYQQEVTINPTLFSFFYDQGNAQMPPAQLFDVSVYPAINNSHIEFEIDYLGVTAGWLSISAVSQPGYSHQMEVNPAGFNAGIYQAKVWARVVDNATGDSLGLSDPAMVNLSVIDNDFINVTPANLSFAHQLGQAFPPAQSVRIDTNVNWTATLVNTDIFDLSASSGNAGSTSIDISLNANADNLSAGTHQLQIKFSNGTIDTLLNIEVQVTDVSGFALSPTTLNFEWLRGSALPASQILHIFSDDEWEIVNKPSWVFIPVTSGNTSATLDVSINNITNMAPGLYTGQIEIIYQGSGDTYLVEVSLNIFNFLETDLEPGKFYFTKDAHWLNFQSNRDNTYINIILNMMVNHWDGTWQTFERVYKLPLFQRKGNFHIGEVVHQLLAHWKNDDTYHGGLRPEPKAARIDAHIKEVDLDTEDIYFQTDILSLKYLKGKYVNDILDSNPNKTRLFIGEYLEFNILVRDVSFFQIENNIDGNTTFTPIMNFWSNNVYKYLYTPYNLPLGSISYLVHNSAKKYFVAFAKSRHFSKIIFENSYGLPENFYTNGKWQLNANYKSFENKVRKDLAEVKETALVLATQKLIIHTGFIFKEEVPALDALMKSRQIYIYNDKLDGVQIRPRTKRLVTKDYDTQMLDYKLEFELIENTDDKIYS